MRQIRVEMGVGRSLVLGAIVSVGVITVVPIPMVAQPSSSTISQSNLSPSQQQALAEAEQLSQQASQLYNQGQYVAAISLAERALDIFEQVLGPNHTVVATSLSNLAEFYRAQGDYAKAQPLLLRALNVQENALGTEHPDVGTSLNNLAGLYYAQGNYAKAVSLLQRVLAIREKTLGPDHPDVAISLDNLAGLYQTQGNYAEAEPLHQRALSIFERALGPNHPNVATSLNTLAGLYYEQGNYAAAESLYKRALAIREQNLGTNHPKVATSLNDLAGLYYIQGNYVEAEILYQRALAINEKGLGPKHPDVATSLNNLAELYRTQGNYAKAEPLFQRALTIDEQALGLDHPKVATSLNNLALLYYAQGNYTEAEPLFQRALAIDEQALGPNHPKVAIGLNNLAGLYQFQGSYAKAESLHLRALSIREKALGPEHPNVANSLNNLALLYQVQGNTASATDLITRATDIEEKTLTLILAAGSEPRKHAYMATLSGVTNRVLSFHFQDAPNNPQIASLALTTVLRRKGRILDVLTDSLQALRQNLTSADQVLLDQLNAVHSQLAEQIYGGVGDTPVLQYRAAVTDLWAKAAQLESALARRSAEFRVQSQAVTISAIQQLIPQGTALVELFLYKPFSAKVAQPNQQFHSPRYAAYILQSQGDPKWVDLGQAKIIDQAIAQFRDNLRDVGTPIDEQLKPSARKLDALVMEPVRKLLGDTRTILLSPDSQLNLVPFAALVDENNDYLVENYTITTLTSGRDLLRYASTNADRKPPVLLANPHFNKPGDPNVLLSQDTQRSTNQRSTDTAQLKVNPLPGTAAEATAITQLLPSMQVLTESKATENALKQLQSPQILHLATHGFFLNIERVAPPDLITRSLLQGSDELRLPPVTQENPLLRSGLALAGFNIRESGDQDGVLTALEVSGLDLRGTQLVVMSACDTGVGDIANGEGVYGLRRAFVIAGAESQLFSLWKVDDEATKDLMVSYYQKLTAGKGRSAAIRETQLEMLNSQDYQHPYYWASFVPSGNWRPIASQPSNPRGD